MSKFLTVSMGQPVCCLDVFEFRRMHGEQTRVAFVSGGFGGQPVHLAAAARGTKTDRVSDIDADANAQTAIH